MALQNIFMVIWSLHRKKKHPPRSLTAYMQKHFDFYSTLFGGFKKFLNKKSIYRELHQPLTN